MWVPLGLGQDKARVGCYLKDFLVQDAGSKDGDAPGVDDRVVPAGQRPRPFLLAVQEERHLLLAHAEGEAVPPAEETGGGVAFWLFPLQINCFNISPETKGAVLESFRLTLTCHS